MSVWSWSVWSTIAKPRITAEVVFLTSEQGGRLRTVIFAATGQYMPHVVVQSREVRKARYGPNHFGIDDYLGVAFVGGPPEYQLGDSAEVVLDLMYHPEVSYDELIPGATFTIREGGRIVGHGVVLTRVDPTNNEVLPSPSGSS